MVLVGVLALGACSGDDGGGAGGDVEGRCSEVLYQIIGNQISASVTYSTGTGVEQRTLRPSHVSELDAGISLCVTPGTALSVSAQKDTSGNGPITCAIRVDGVEVARNESSGAYAVVSCASLA